MGKKNNGLVFVKVFGYIDTDGNAVQLDCPTLVFPDNFPKGGIPLYVDGDKNLYSCNPDNHGRAVIVEIGGRKHKAPENNGARLVVK